MPRELPSNSPSWQLRRVNFDGTRWALLCSRTHSYEVLGLFDSLADAVSTFPDAHVSSRYAPPDAQLGSK